MNMDWIFWAFLGASLLHMLEEYKYPGGFPDYMKRTSLRFAPAITTQFAIIINGLQIILCIAAIIVGDRNLLFSLSVAGLLLTNALMHIGGTIRFGRYVPGVLSSVGLYLPLSLFAYVTFAGAERISTADIVASSVLGFAYQAVPVIWLAVSSQAQRWRAN
jgi:hypothetical protein